MRAIVAGSLPWALGLLALCITSLELARAEAPKRQHGSLEIELRAPDACPGPAQFAQLLRARLAGQAEPRARIVVTIAAQSGGVRAELQVQRAGQTTERRLEAASCAEAVNALSLVAALILDATPAPSSDAPQPVRRSARGSARAPAQPAEPGVTTSEGAPGPEAMEPAGPAPQSTVSDAAREAERVEPAPASAPSTPPPTPPASARASADMPRARPPRSRGQLVLDLFASALLMTDSAPAIRPGAALGLGLGVKRAALVVAGEVDARAALPHTETTAQGSARFALVAAGVRLCVEGRVLQERLGVSGCGSTELGTLAARGRDTEAPESSRSLWAAVGPGLRLSWYGPRRVGLRLGSELLLPLTRPSYTLGEVPVFSVPPVTFRAELALRVRLL